MHAVHLAGGALRQLDAAHILLTDKSTVRISDAATLDLLRPDKKSVAHLQVGVSFSLVSHAFLSLTDQSELSLAEDLHALGRLLVCLCCQSLGAATQTALAKSMAYIAATFSPEMHQLLLLLFANPPPTVHDAVMLCSGRMMTHMAQTQWYADALASELTKECENGRLLRLLAKLNYVTDRTQLGMDMAWGEHADRQLLRMFRDSLFQEVDENGAAVIDFAHVVHGPPLSPSPAACLFCEGFTLTAISRIDGSLLLVSPRDLKGLLERSLNEVINSQHQLQMEPEMGPEQE
ncbi:MAG: hypothetical protein SGPRY_006780 [Prymnesium sp.]